MQHSLHGVEWQAPQTWVPEPHTACPCSPDVMPEEPTPQPAMAKDSAPLLRHSPEQESSSTGAVPCWPQDLPAFWTL